MPEAPVRMSKNGLVVDGEGWFVVNARQSRWKDEGPLGSYCTFEGKRRFPHFGINISVLDPGERMGMYHRENAQEAFLVLAGECTLIVEGEERLLTEWDFFYCAPGTDHIIVASGVQSAVVLAVVPLPAAASSTRSARRRRGMGRAWCGRPPTRPRHTRRSGRSFPVPGSSSTSAAGSIETNSRLGQCSGMTPEA